MIFEDFTSDAAERWDYVADRVMGGVSSGEAQIVRDGADSAVHLTGTVSTDNNGGFIQVRHRFAGGWGKTRGACGYQPRAMIRSFMCSYAQKGYRGFGIRIGLPLKSVQNWPSLRWISTNSNHPMKGCPRRSHQILFKVLVLWHTVAITRQT